MCLSQNHFFIFIKQFRKFFGINKNQTHLSLQHKKLRGPCNRTVLSSILFFFFFFEKKEEKPTFQTLKLKFKKRKIFFRRKKERTPFLFFEELSFFYDLSSQFYEKQYKQRKIISDKFLPQNNNESRQKLKNYDRDKLKENC